MRRLSWKEPGLEVVVDDLRIDWTPGALFEKRLAIGELAAARLRLDIASSDEATPPPASLTLPVAVDIQKMAISRLDYGQVFSAGDLRGVFASDGTTHRLSDFGARLGLAVIAGSAELGGSAPLPLRVDASIAGKLDDQAVRLAVSADGPLERIEVKVAAEEGVSGSGRALLTPFARQPFAEARLELADVDPAAWIDGAPAARLTLQADVRPDERQADAVAGSFELRNASAGPLDRQRLPLERLSGRFAWNDDGGRFSDLQARLPGSGRLSGTAVWRDAALSLDLAARDLDAAQLASVLRSTRLNGPISATVGSTRQQLTFRLADQRFTLAAEASHENGKVSLTRLELSAGDAVLRASGELATGEEMAFSASGELARFDPSRFARVPAAALNGTLAASGRLRPVPPGTCFAAKATGPRAQVPLGCSRVPSSRRSSPCATAVSPASRWPGAASLPSTGRASRAPTCS